ncbi:MAG TPA: MerC domain-containing protein [Sphingomonas sp.]|jgi:uncharacterized membrane protein YdfJ with MMPL/SSD domain
MHSSIRLSWLSRLPNLDRYAMGLSGLCAVHCFASAVLVALASTAGGMLLNPAFHEIGLTVAIILGALALGRGIFEHGYMAPAVTGSLGLGMMAGAMQLPHGNGGETLWTLIGVAILALGHDLNRRATH